MALECAMLPVDKNIGSLEDRVREKTKFETRTSLAIVNG
jgi:hypothetical protein